MEFKDKLKQLRTDKRLSQVELADALGVSVASIGMYETGERLPGEEVRKKIADYFQISVAELMGYTANAREEKTTKLELELLMCLNNIEGFIKGLAVKTENERERENLISYAKSLHNCVEDLLCQKLADEK